MGTQEVKEKYVFSAKEMYHVIWHTPDWCPCYSDPERQIHWFFSPEKICLYDGFELQYSVKREWL